ncbi:MAG: HupE/UreJ family protein [Verrucomicrobia bacterium]|nr:HupE/UreJ family protein [Verrucomicrobiota bacterium]
MKSLFRHLRRAVLMFAVWLAADARLLAHDPGLSTATFKLTATRAECQLTFARLDVETLVRLDTDGDGKISAAELAAAQPRLDGLATNALEFRADGALLALQSSRAWLDETNNIHLDLAFVLHAPKQLSVFSALIKKMPANHRQFVVLQDGDGQTLAEALLSASQDVVDVDVAELLAGEKPPPDRARLFREFFVMGVQHILTGYDHLLFLLGVLIVMTRLKATIWVITCFTLAHSTTLALAALDVVNLNGQVVEPLIAATIVFVGVENLTRRDAVKQRWLVTLIFGLIHGLGFATDLKAKLAAATGIAVPLISFNLGVELGQMGVAAVVLPALWWLREKPLFVRWGVPAVSVVVVLLGAWWLVQRTILS